MILLLFLVGLVLLIVGAEALVRGAARIAVALGITPLVVGLTVVAFGTSAPELAVGVQSAYAGKPDLAIGNVIGSNIANILLILGLTAAIIPLTVQRQLIRIDVPIMIGASIVMAIMSIDGVINRFDGLLLVVALVGYVIFTIHQSRAAQNMQAGDDLGFDPVPPRSARTWLFNLGLCVVGLGLLVQGANWIVDGAVAFARLLGVDELIIGLTIIAVGTSLPEIATSVLASLRGQRDMAVGNAIGSNIFNIFSVLGVTALVAPAGVGVADAAIAFDLPVMLVVALACLPIFLRGGRIDRWEGVLFLVYYAAYTIYLILFATENTLLPLFSSAMIFFVVPLTVVTLVVLLLFEWRQRRLARA
ncbi:MAG TPA: calcium/sodium antiporter [Roseiflexaceae bacterium]|nr:calcium/sodium antiporter [Roseiflexaceae bacterium]HMP40516.1 calcium/sodium antiporter [Roseiflexaceae bacterium]